MRRFGRSVLLVAGFMALSGCALWMADDELVLERVAGANPVYPEAAKRDGIEGEVTLVYTVTRTGEVTDLEILESSPPGIFDDAALAAVRTWRYRPVMAGGEPVAQETVGSTLTFRLGPAYEDY